LFDFKSKKRLEDILIEAGIITISQLEEAMNFSRLDGEEIGDVLIRLGYVTEEQIISILSMQLRIPVVKLDYYPINRNIFYLIPDHLIRNHCLIPLDLNNDQLIIAVSDPLDLGVLDEIKMITGYEVFPVISSVREIKEVITRYYDLLQPIYETSPQMVGVKKEEEQNGKEAVDTRIIVDKEQAPAVRLVDLVIKQAVEQRSSDIHFEPKDGGLKIRYRIDGILRDTISLPVEITPAIISRLKIMANMDIAEKRVPQDGRISLNVGGKKIDLRLSTLPTILGEKIVIRILDKSQGIIKMQNLGMSDSHLKLFQKMLRYPYGMILATGPTGCGKTTTLFSGLETINSPQKNIITIEDPVEYTLEGVNQVQVNVKAGLTFANGLRAILRQDPDVIMVGEIRDSETADIAIRSAMTGHLVLSTLHTNDAVSTISRLVDMGIEPFLLSSALIGVISQRLVRVICNNCKLSYPAEEDRYISFFLLPQEYRGKMLYKGNGCSQCQGTGYKGRIGIYEILEVNGEIRDLIGARLSVERMRNITKPLGMISMFKDGLEKAFAGITTVDEIMRVTFAEEGGK